MMPLKLRQIAGISGNPSKDFDKPPQHKYQKTVSVPLLKQHYKTIEQSSYSNKQVDSRKRISLHVPLLTHPMGGTFSLDTIEPQNTTHRKLYSQQYQSAKNAFKPEKRQQLASVLTQMR